MVAVTQARRATDRGEPTNADLLARFDELDRRMSAWITEHRADHKELDSWKENHVRDAGIRQYELDKIVPDVEEAHDVVVLLKGLVGTVRLIGVGVIASIAASVISAYFLWVHLAQSAHP